MEFMLHVRLVKPESMTNKEFFEVWRQESVGVLAAIDAGVVKNAWKVSGTYEVVAILEVENHDQMDDLVHALPIWKTGYSHIVPDVTWKPLRSYASWAEHLKTLSTGEW